MNVNKVSFGDGLKELCLLSTVAFDSFCDCTVDRILISVPASIKRSLERKMFKN